MRFLPNRKAKVITLKPHTHAILYIIFLHTIIILYIRKILFAIDI